ncbi:MAG: glycosyltransferase family 39 protein [Candidatus Aminicenantes bacterium]|nr:MAG: glycosyltransferase family 39 protein [Candidatus Aminicenantes bacterium]
MQKENKKLLLIVMLAFSLRLILFLATSPWKEEIQKERILKGDSKGYHRIALNLTENNTYSSSESPPYLPDTNRPPLYPFFLATIYSFVGEKPEIAIFFNLILSSLTCVLTFIVAKKLFNKKVALFASLFIAVEYSNIILSNRLLTESLFTLLFIVHIIFLLKFFLQDTSKALVLSALFLGLSTLCRPVSVYFFLFLIGIFLFNYKKNLRKGALKYSVFVLVFFLSLFPWMVRNYSVSGKFIVSSQQGLIVKGYFRYLFRYQKKTGYDSPQLIVKNQRPETDISKKANNTYTNARKRRPLNALWSGTKNSIKAGIRFFTIIGRAGFCKQLGLPYGQIQIKDLDENTFTLIKTIINKKTVLELIILSSNLCFLFFLYSTMCFGAYRSIKEKRYFELFLLLTILIYFLLASLTVSYTNRFRIPIMPYIVIFSCYGLEQIQDRLKGSKRRLKCDQEK